MRIHDLGGKELYADLATLGNKSLGNMVDRFLVVHGAYSTQAQRDTALDFAEDAPLRLEVAMARRKFRKLVRRGRKLLRATGWTWAIHPGDAIKVAARAWERRECGRMRGCVPIPREARP